MRVRLLYFGVLKDLVGAAEAAVELREGTTVGGLLEVLRGGTSNSGMGNVADDGGQDRLWRGLAVAVNRQYCSPSQILCEGDEVALLPPVSGGCFALGEKLASLAETFEQGLPDEG
jgi:molybdopterin converting factor small subunit